MGFVADIDTAGVRMNHFQTEICALDLPHRRPPLLAVHFVPGLRRRMVGCFLGFLLWLGFHATLSVLDSTRLGPVGENYSISAAGSGRSPLQDNARHHPHNRTVPEPC
jgi:hypothetical protein